VGLAAPSADLVVLVKPQFEAGRAEVSRGRGVVRGPDVWSSALRDVATGFELAGARVVGAMVSPLIGTAGNVEFFLHLRAHDSAAGPGQDIGELVSGALSEVPGAIAQLPARGLGEGVP